MWSTQILLVVGIDLSCVSPIVPSVFRGVAISMDPINLNLCLKDVFSRLMKLRETPAVRTIIFRNLDYGEFYNGAFCGKNTRRKHHR